MKYVAAFSIALLLITACPCLAGEARTSEIASTRVRATDVESMTVEAPLDLTISIPANLENRTEVPPRVERLRLTLAGLEIGATRGRPILLSPSFPGEKKAVMVNVGLTW